MEAGKNLKTDADRVVDVSGCLLFPGFIDAHTHFDLDVCNTTTADDFYTGSRAALRGGTTIQGVRTLEEAGFRGAVMDAVIAAYEKNFDLK